MNSGLARTTATLFLVSGLTLAGCYLFANKPAGTFGFTSTFVTGKPVARVDEMVPHGAAQRAGLHTNDLISAPSATLEDRAALYLLANPPLVAKGDRARIIVLRSTVNRPALLIADGNPSSPRLEAAYFCVLAIPILLLGWFIIWRKAESSDAVTLGFMLLLFGLWIAFPDRVGNPLVRLLFYEIVSSGFVILGVLTAAIFFARYPQGRGTQVSPLRRACMQIAIAASVVEIILMTLAYLLPAYSGGAPWLTVPTIVFVLVPPLAALVCMLDAFRRGDATDRMRLRWLGGSYFIGFSGPLLVPAATLLLGSQFTIVHQALLESTLFILAIGLTYGILRRRVVDVSVVLNRALVFGAVSGIVVACFICFEWLVGSFFINMSRATSFLVQVGAAIIIGFSLRPLHNRVDHFIDRVFFAKRHASEKALRHLAMEVNFLRERSALLERVERDLTNHMDASLVAIYFREDMRGDFLLLRSTTDAPEFIEADDDAAVALAVREAPIELHGCQTLMIGEVAVPLAVRKELVGILILGEKVSGEAFAGGEIESLSFLAGYLGTALVTNSNSNANGASSASVLKSILDELRLQREDLRQLNENLRASGRPS